MSSAVAAGIHMPQATHLRGAAAEVVCANVVQVVQEHLRLVQKGIVPRILQHIAQALGAMALTPIWLTLLSTPHSTC